MAKRILVIAFFLFVTGCASFGPRVLVSDRYNYNRALGNSDKQEILLNIIRLRYNESPVILSVGNISASARLDKTARLTGTWSLPGPYVNNNLVGGATVDYTDNPIISYTPLHTSEYTTQFLSALKVPDLSLLLQSSWSITRLLQIALQRVSNAENAASAARPTSSHVPHYKDFIQFTYVLRRLQLHEALTYSIKKVGQHDELVIHIDKKYRKFTPKEQRVMRKVGIEVYKGDIIFSTVRAPHRNYIVTRSLLGILNYLSKGVIIPPEDAARHFVKQTYYKNGKLFDWQSALNGLITIYYSTSIPKDVAVMVPYRGRWYYIKDSDTDSKESLIMVANFFSLVEKMPPGSESTVGLTRNV